MMDTPSTLYGDGVLPSHAERRYTLRNGNR